MESTIQQQRLLRVRQAAEYLSICERSLWTLIKLGKIPSIRLGRSVRIDLCDLDAFIETAKGKAN